MRCMPESRTSPRSQPNHYTRACAFPICTPIACCGIAICSKKTWGHVDIPRLIKGNIALQAFSVVTKTPRGANIERNSATTDNIRLLSVAQRWPPRTWTSLKERAVYQAQKLHDFAARSNGTLVIVKSSADLQAYLARRRTGARVTAGWLSIEGAHALGLCRKV